MLTQAVHCIGQLTIGACKISGYGKDRCFCGKVNQKRYEEEKRIMVLCCADDGFWHE